MVNISECVMTGAISKERCMTLLTERNELAVRLEQVEVAVRRAEVVHKILQDVSLTAKSGLITAVIGPSGGGKSTLVRLINRLAEPTSGTIYVGEQDVRELDPLELRRLVALVSQKPFMFEGTVLENLQRPFLYRGEPLPAAESEEVRRAVELARLDQGMVQRDARTLSGGEQQRVSLARALITQPRVLLLDEPTSALDRPTGDALAATFKEVCRREKLTVILVTHDLRVVERIADHCLYLEAGRILEEGSAEELFNRPRSAELRRFLSEPAEKEG
jgi:putative ABC transport system ATP-binding protein